MSKTFLATILAAALLAPVASAIDLSMGDVQPAGPNDAPDVRCEHFSAAEIADAHGVIIERFPTSDPDMYVEVHMYCALEAVDDSLSALTDCTAKNYSLTGWHWPAAYSGQIDTSNSYGFSSATVLGTFTTAANTWDTAVAADIFGSFVQGGASKDIRRQDFVNQHGFKKLGGGGTIAVTYTWAYSDGRAAESDAAYNTFYAWGVNGESNKMDLQGIAAHELGHTFGLGHSTTAAANQCLTMYPYGDYGQTYQRTLGDGDILGIEAIY